MAFRIPITMIPHEAGFTGDFSQSVNPEQGSYINGAGGNRISRRPQLTGSLRGFSVVLCAELCASHHSSQLLQLLEVAESWIHLDTDDRDEVLAIVRDGVAS